VITFVLLLATLLSAPRPPEGEARISLDVKDAPVVDVVRLLAEVAGFQVVMDPGLTCALTLKLTAVRWQTVLDLSLRSCGLGREEEGGVIRVAPAARLLEESAARRRLEEEQKASAPRSLKTFRLSYARAEQMAPLLKRWLSSKAEVIYDARTNTLVIRGLPE
jgi:type II secretory pathway component HofQ